MQPTLGVDAERELPRRRSRSPRAPRRRGRPPRASRPATGSGSWTSTERSSSDARRPRRDHGVPRPTKTHDARPRARARPRRRRPSPFRRGRRASRRRRDSMPLARTARRRKREDPLRKLFAAARVVEEAAHVAPCRRRRPPAATSRFGQAVAHVTESTERSSQLSGADAAMFVIERTRARRIAPAREARRFCALFAPFPSEHHTIHMTSSGLRISPRLSQPDLEGGLMVRRSTTDRNDRRCVRVGRARASPRRPAPPPSTASADGALLSCSNPIQIGMIGPFTGPAASIGDDQLHWAQFFATTWNKTHKLQLTIVQGDTQLDPAKASVVAQSMASNSSIVGVIGPAGSQEVTARPRSSRRPASPSCPARRRTSTLTDGKLKGYFFRVVPNDGVQAPTAASYMMTKLGAKKGTTVMIVDDQESYSTGLADGVGKRAQEGRRDGRPRVDQPEDDRLLVARRQGRRARRRSCSRRSSSRRRRSSSPSS